MSASIVPALGAALEVDANALVLVVAELPMLAVASLAPLLLEALAVPRAAVAAPVLLDAASLLLYVPLLVMAPDSASLVVLAVGVVVAAALQAGAPMPAFPAVPVNDRPI